MRRFCFMIAAILAGGTAPVSAATTTAVTTVRVVKPVSLSKLQDLDFGTLTFGGFTGTRTITLSQAGAFTCAVDIVCSGTPRTARFNMQGTNKLTANITVSGGTLSNGTDSIPFTHSAPTSIYIANSGAPGTDFNVGGSIVVSSAVIGGEYAGTLTVTAEYQ